MASKIIAPRKGERITAKFLQELTDRVNLLSNLKVFPAGSGRLDVTEGNAALTLTLPELPKLGEVVRLSGTVNGQPGFVDVYAVANPQQLDTGGLLS